MTIQEAIKDFLEVRELDNCSPKTLRTYEQRLRYFSTWLETAHSILDIESLQVAHLRGWLAYLKKTPTYRGKAMSDESIHSYGETLIAFCHWLEIEEKLEKPLTPRFKLPRMEKKFIPTYNADDVKKLLDACEESDLNDPVVRRALAARNRAIVSLFIDTGIRLGELLLKTVYTRAGIELTDPQEGGILRKIKNTTSGDRHAQESDREYDT